MGRFDFFQPNVEEMVKKRDVDALIKALTAGNDWDGTWSIRADAAKALGKIGDVRAVEPLIQAMKRNGHIRARSSAAYALDELGFQPKNDEEKAYYLMASNSWGDLVNVGEPAVKPLIETLESIHENTTQWGVAKALGEIGDSMAVQPLTQILMKESRKGEMGEEILQKRAVEALGKIGDARAVEPLTQALKNVYPDVRQEAAKALEKIQAKKSPQDQHRTSE
jgi:HEAT repeat protein